MGEAATGEMEGTDLHLQRGALWKSACSESDQIAWDGFLPRRRGRGCMICREGVGEERGVPKEVEE